MNEQLQLELQAYLKHAKHLEQQGRVIELRRFANWAGKKWEDSLHE